MTDEIAVEEIEEVVNNITTEHIYVVGSSGNPVVGVHFEAYIDGAEFETEVGTYIYNYYEETVDDMGEGVKTLVYEDEEAITKTGFLYDCKTDSRGMLYLKLTDEQRSLGDLILVDDDGVNHLFNLTPTPNIHKKVL